MEILYKVHLFKEETGEYEIRRFSAYNVLFYDLVEKIKTIFPKLSNELFLIQWLDEEGDKVTISSQEEFDTVLKLSGDVKKLYVKVLTPGRDPQGNRNEAVHLGVVCDGCDKTISGIRYKCGFCDDYDLCSYCRESGIHEEHPMYRIPHPLNIDSGFGIGISLEKHKSRRHSDCGKKKRRFEKRESGPETGDECEETCHGKYFHKKCKKSYKCRCRKEGIECGKAEGGDNINRFYGAGPYGQIVNDFLGYFNPVHFQPRPSQPENPTRKTNRTEIPSHASYMQNLGATLQKILDPLGVNVEFEVRQKEERKEEKKNEKEEKQPSGSNSPTAPHQKEVRFGVNEQTPETMSQKIEEITKILSNQTVSNGNDNDNGWVSFEELKKDSEEPQPSSSSQTQASAPEENKKEEFTGKQNLYPNLTRRVPTNPAVRRALEKMLEMGFTNEGDWLTSLLEAKDGDIGQALEVLSFHKKVTK